MKTEKGCEKPSVQQKTLTIDVLRSTSRKCARFIYSGDEAGLRAPPICTLLPLLLQIQRHHWHINYRTAPVLYATQDPRSKRAGSKYSLARNSGMIFTCSLLGEHSADPVCHK